MLFKTSRMKHEEELKRVKASGVKKAGAAFAIGAAIAAVVTLFTTPKSGPEMRADAKEKGGQLLDKTSCALDETLEKGKEFKSKVISKFSKEKPCCSDEGCCDEDIYIEEEEKQDEQA